MKAVLYIQSNPSLNNNKIALALAILILFWRKAEQEELIHPKRYVLLHQRAAKYIVGTSAV